MDRREPRQNQGDNRLHKLQRIAHIITQEADNASSKFKKFNSIHEAYAVILEELDELWDEVKQKKGTPDYDQYDRMFWEAVQIAAMCMRFIYDLIPWEDHV